MDKITCGECAMWLGAACGVNRRYWMSPNATCACTPADFAVFRKALAKVDPVTDALEGLASACCELDMALIHYMSETPGCRNEASCLRVQEARRGYHNACQRLMQAGWTPGEEEADSRKREEDIRDDMDIFSQQTYIALKRAGVTSIKQLVGATGSEIAALRGIGKKRFREIRECLLQLERCDPPQNEEDRE